MRRPSPAVRLFVAIHPPESCRLACLAALADLNLPSGSFRATPADQVHLTLQFIGQVPQRELDDVVESVERSASGVSPFRLTPRCLTMFPESGPPRLVALELDSPPQLLELKRRLARRLSRHTRAEDPERFRPHITLCRFTGEARIPRLEQEVSLPPFDAAELVLFRSVLRPSGARHSEVIHAPLTGPPPRNP